MTVPSDAGYVGLYQCSDITVEDLTIFNVGQGVLVADSFDILISHVTTQDCLVGIDMSGSYGSSVEHCLIDHSYNHGIKIYQVSTGFGGNHIENTTVTGTYSPVLGSNIFLSSSSNNEIFDCNVSGSVGSGCMSHIPAVARWFAPPYQEASKVPAFRWTHHLIV